MAKKQVPDALEAQLKQLATITPLKKQQAAAVKLATEVEVESDAIAVRVCDAILAIDATGSSRLADVQYEIIERREREAAYAIPLPETAAEFETLLAESETDKLAELVLMHGLETGRASFARGLANAVIVRARAGGTLLAWMDEAPDETKEAPEYEKSARAAFAAKGPLAKSIVDMWNAADAKTALYADLLEQRRRAGELYAGLPDDIKRLAETDRAAAVSEYARRYGLPAEKRSASWTRTRNDDREEQRCVLRLPFPFRRRRHPWNACEIEDRAIART
ncbi:MAG: hypothetical protein QM831_36625 [Kofleriaceae bacterium]